MQDLNQTLFISIISYKLKAAEIVTSSISASRGQKKRRKKEPEALEERGWSPDPLWGRRGGKAANAPSWAGV